MDKKVYDRGVERVNIDLVPGRPIIIMSISGGKDSLAMWLTLSERGYVNLVPVTYVCGWEWECAGDEIKRVEKITGGSCVVLDDRALFDREFSKKGFPSWGYRWCTGRKVEKLRRYRARVARGYPDYKVVEAVGIAADEKKRKVRKGLNDDRIILPLVEWGITERAAMRICLRAGCSWGYHYLSYDRLSCWCCPFQRRDDLFTLWSDHPHKWGALLAWDDGLPPGRRWRWHNKSLRQLAREFEKQSINLKI